MGILEYILPILIVASAIIYTLLQLFFYSFLSVRKRIVFGKVARMKLLKWFHAMPRATLAYSINIVVCIVLWTLCIVFSKFWLNIVLAILALIWLVFTIDVIFFRQKIVNKMLNNAKNSKKSLRNIKRIQRLNKLKYKIEYSDSAVSLYDAFHNCPVLNTNKTFDLNQIYEKVKAYGDCTIAIDDNISGSKFLNEAASLYVSIVDNKGKVRKERFAYVFDINKYKGTKGRKMLFLFKIGFKEKGLVFEKYQKSTPCRYPLGCNYISFPLDDSIPIDDVEYLVDSAYNYTKSRLEDKEVNNIGKKINL